jgi:hypothetical protein
MPFFKNRNRKVKQVLSGGWYLWEKKEYKETVKEAKCSGNVMYSCMKKGKMRPVETITGMGGRGIKENDGGSKFKYNIL